jgi:hypothetical protein
MSFKQFVFSLFGREDEFLDSTHQTDTHSSESPKTSSRLGSLFRKHKSSTDSGNGHSSHSEHTNPPTILKTDLGEHDQSRVTPRYSQIRNELIKPKSSDSDSTSGNSPAGGGVPQSDDTEVDLKRGTCAWFPCCYATDHND